MLPMQEISYRSATSADIALLVEFRAAFLAEVAEANPTDSALLDVLTRYFSSTVPSGEFIALVAFTDDRAIATGGLVYHRHPPSPKNLKGVEAYIMNMYTLPAYRGRGVASSLLKQLVAVAAQSNCRRIRLHAHPKAVPVYTRSNFASVNNEMKLDLR
jgi:GNAT superfamily N-acetyltransferase